MTGQRPEAVAVVGWLRIDCGQHTRPWVPAAGRWVRYPTADYWCGRCGAIESASGDAVAAFVNTIRRTHRATCPTPREDT